MSNAVIFMKHACLENLIFYISDFLTTDHTERYDWIVSTKAESLVGHEICWSQITNDVLSNT
jgi:hypothetical protein